MFLFLFFPLSHGHHLYSVPLPGSSQQVLSLHSCQLEPSLFFFFFVPVGTRRLWLCLLPAGECHLHALLLLHTRAPVSPGGKLFPVPGALIFAADFHKTPPDCPALVGSRAYACSPTGLYIPVYFKRCYLRVWLPISLNLSSSSLGHWQILAGPRLLGAIKKKISFLNNHKGLRDDQELGLGWRIRLISYTSPLLQDWER